MNKMFMIDIESTGFDYRKDDILQIALLELNKKDGFWVPGMVFSQFLGTRKQPADSFAREHMQAIYDHCNTLPLPITDEVWADLKFFLVEAGACNLAFLTGQNASGFDVPFCTAKGYLRAPQRHPVTNELSGDYHYRIYEMGGVISFAQDLLNEPDRKALEKRAMECYPEIQLPPGSGQHEAVYDCFLQAKTLNGLIRLCRDGQPRSGK